MEYPAQVLIIRHGEKLRNASDDNKGGPDLAVARDVRLPRRGLVRRAAVACAQAGGAAGKGRQPGTTAVPATTPGRGRS